MPAADKIKETAKDEVREITRIASDGLRSGAYFYPLRGIFYLATHKDLYKPLVARLVPTAGLGLSVTSIMFLFTYVPQMAVLAFTSGPIAALTAGLLVLSESGAITMALSRALLIGDNLIDTFDGTLVARGHEGLVAAGREVRPASRAGDAFARLGRRLARPLTRLGPQAWVRYFVTLPLNFIPVVGTAVFVLMQGRRVGPAAHARYFQLKSMGSTEQEKFVEQRRGAYTGFGVAAAMLEMVPVVGILFAFSNACGAALWAADMENARGTAPGLKQQAAKVK